MAIIPQQNRTVDPYSSYKSSKINQFAQLITKTNVSKGIIDGLEVTTGGNTAVNILSGKCLKDNVLIEITESILLTKNNTSCSGVNSGVGYVVINYTYVPTYPPKVAYLDVVTQDEYNNNSSKYIILAGLYNLGNWTSINYNSRMMLSPTDMLTSVFMSFDLQDKYLRRDSDTAPDTNEAYDLGSEDHRFKNVYTKNVHATNIGSSSNKVSDAYIDNIHIDKCKTSLIPDINNIHDLGSEDYKFKNVYANTVNLTSVYANNIGSSSNKVANIFSANAFTETLSSNSQIEILQSDNSWIIYKNIYKQVVTLSSGDSNLIFVQIPFSIDDNVMVTLTISVITNYVKFGDYSISFRHDEEDGHGVFTVFAKNVTNNGYICSYGYDIRGEFIKLCTKSNQCYVKLGGRYKHTSGYGFWGQYACVVIKEVIVKDVNGADIIDSYKTGYDVQVYDANDIYSTGGYNSSSDFDFDTYVNDSNRSMNIVDYDILPRYDGQYNIGSSSYKWKDIYGEYFSGDADQWDGGDKYISNQDASGSATDGSVWFKYED